MRKLFTFMSALLLLQTMAVAQNYLRISQGDSLVSIPFRELDSVTVRDADFYRLQLTPSGLDGVCYTGRVLDAFGRDTYTFNLKLVDAGDGKTMYIYDLDPFFFMNGFEASIGYNILQGTLVTATDGKSATLTCATGQLMGYSDVMFVNPSDASLPIVFTITEDKISCDTGYGLYTASQGGYYSAFWSFQLSKSTTTRVAQAAPVMRKAAVPTTQPEMKLIPLEINRAPKQRISQHSGMLLHTPQMEVAPKRLQ